METSVFKEWIRMCLDNADMGLSGQRINMIKEVSVRELKVRDRKIKRLENRLKQLKKVEFRKRTGKFYRTDKIPKKRKKLHKSSRAIYKQQ